MEILCTKKPRWNRVEHGFGIVTYNANTPFGPMHICERYPGLFLWHFGWNPPNLNYAKSFEDGMKQAGEHLKKLLWDELCEVALEMNRLRRGLPL